MDDEKVYMDQFESLKEAIYSSLSYMMKVMMMRRMMIVMLKLVLLKLMKLMMMINCKDGSI